MQGEEIGQEVEGGSSVQIFYSMLLFLLNVVAQMRRPSAKHRVAIFQRFLWGGFLDMTSIFAIFVLGGTRLLT